MRRLLPAALLVTLAMGLCPARADAYIWHWIDDLSGPRFDGVSFELKFLCRLEDQRTLEALLDRAQRDYRTYSATTSPSSSQALGFVNSALANLDQAGKMTASDDRTAKLEAAYKDLLNAESSTAVADQSSANFAERTALRALAVGGSASLCKTRAFQRNQAFLSSGAGFGWDVKGDHKAQHNHIWQAWIGANYVLDRTVTVGAGVGEAVFTSHETPDGPVRATPVPYYYAQIDVRPWALRSNSIARGPWWQAVYVRMQYQQFLEPIRAGAFGKDSPRYPKETVANIGVWVDFEPLWRHYVKKNWQ